MCVCVCLIYSLFFFIYFYRHISLHLFNIQNEQIRERETDIDIDINDSIINNNNQVHCLMFENNNNNNNNNKHQLSVRNEMRDNFCLSLLCFLFDYIHSSGSEMRIIEWAFCSIDWFNFNCLFWKWQHNAVSLNFKWPLKCLHFEIL